MAEQDFNNFIEKEASEIAKQNKVNKYHLDIKAVEGTSNYRSKKFHVKIAEEDGSKKTINILFKFAVLNSKGGRGALPLEDLFKKEIYSYSVTLPELAKYQEENSIHQENKFTYPKFYKGVQDFMKEYLVMEDLSALNYKAYGRDKLFDYEHSKAVLKSLASLHAVSFAMKAKDPLRFAKLKENIDDQVNYPDVLYSMLTNLTDAILPYLKSEEQRDDIKDFASKGRPLMRQCLDSTLTAPYNVICHGDMWNNNIVFKRKDNKLEARFLDYQLMRYASPATDIPYLFLLSTEKPFRDENFDKLCDEYYDALGKCLEGYGCDVKKLYPRDVMDRQLIEAIPFGILFGLITCTIVLMKPEEKRKLDDLVGDGKLGFSRTDAMVERLQNLAIDIRNYNNRKRVNPREVGPQK